MSSDCPAAIGRGNEIVCFAIEQIAKRIVGLDLAPIFADMGKFWDFCKPSIFYNNKIETKSADIFFKVVSDPQHRWLGPEKGVIHLATAAISNAVWDMYAKHAGKPLWKLIVDFTPEEYVPPLKIKEKKANCQEKIRKGHLFPIHHRRPYPRRSP